jgi:SAM-dependent methyltransferase
VKDVLQMLGADLADLLGRRIPADHSRSVLADAYAARYLARPDRPPAPRVLDLGCGGGFFLFVLQQLGHTGLGLDIDEFPLFTRLLELFQVERRLWTIRPFEPLPDLGRKFDLITAFSIDFNRESKRDWWWGPPEWAFFLDDLERHLNPGGRIFLGLNPSKNKEFYTPELREFFLARGASVERENVLFPPKGSSAN